MESPQRRSGIPILKTKSTLKKILSKSSDDLLGDDSYNQNGDLDLFTILEENIALKERTEHLHTKHNTVLQKNVQLERENSRLGKQLDDLKVQQKHLKDQLQTLMDKFQKEINEGRTIQNIQEQQKKLINELMQKVHIQEEKHTELLNAGKEAKNKLEEMVPEINRTHTDNSSRSDIVTTETVEQLIGEIGNMKTQMNNTELQLYEANEKIAELIENHHHLQQENESLKVENSNLTTVAKLMTESMKESVDTGKRMEEALMQMRKRNDELLRANKDATDSPGQQKFFSPNEQVLQLQDELKKREATHTERIVEMNTNDEINVLRIKLDIVEKELQFAIDRAEKAEAELEQLKQCYRSSYNLQKPFESYANSSGIRTPWAAASDTTIETVQSTAPPPPPPPMPIFNLPPVILVQSGVSLSDGIAAFTLNNAQTLDSGSVGNQQVKTATGMDALIAELRDGHVTLRRSHRKTASNAALQEMFDTLELSRRQNRNSRIVMETVN